MLRDSDSLERRVEKLERINAALMQRLERMEETRGSSYALTRTAAMLEREVLVRNRELERALSELSATNAELAAAREAADEASRAKSRFLRAASHDLLQPLSAAKLFLAHLGEIVTSPVQGELVARILANFDSAEELIRALLEIGKLDSTRAEVSIGPLSIGRLFQRLSTDLSPLAAARGVELRFVPSSRTVLSDPVLLRSVAQNLVSNALKYTTGGRVLVGVRADGGAVWLEVHDRGPGIAPADQGRIFNEFERLSRSDQPGSGLGLSIVQRACARLGHALELRSAPGQGSTFRVQLPLVGNICLLPPHRAPDPEEARGEIARLSGRHVAVVENDEGMRLAFAFLLESWGMRVTAAPGAGAALAALAGEAPDVLLTDYRLDEGETGEGAIRALRATFGEVPALLVSAEPFETIAAVADPLEAAVLQKPMAEGELRRVLCALIATADPARRTG